MIRSGNQKTHHQISLIKKGKNVESARCSQPGGVAALPDDLDRGNKEETKIKWRTDVERLLCNPEESIHYRRFVPAVWWPVAIVSILWSPFIKEHVRTPAWNSRERDDRLQAITPHPKSTELPGTGSGGCVPCSRANRSAIRSPARSTISVPRYHPPPTT